MDIQVRINGERRTLQIAPGDTLLAALRREGYYSVKHGCEDGSCGNCTVLVNGRPQLACITLAAHVEGAELTTVEGVSAEQHRGWRQTDPLHPLQQTFIETGAVQCGYCTPAMIIVAKKLLDENPSPTEQEVRQTLSGVLCRCTGYVKPVQAVLRAAAVMRGEEVPPIALEEGIPAPADLFPPRTEPDEALPPADLGPETVGGPAVKVRTTPMPTMIVSKEMHEKLSYVGKPERKVDAEKLVQGKPAFTADIEMRGMLVAKIKHSPHAHAIIKKIDVSKARALPGVHAVLTYQDVPRVPFTTAGQSDPIPGPLDFVSLDRKVRYVGDRVAAVAAETEEIAEQALELIDVEYEVLPAVLDAREAMAEGAPVIHDQPDYGTFFGDPDPSRNIAARIHIDLGNVDEAIKQADHVFEAEYYVPKVQQTPLEPYVCVTWWDEDDRLVIRSSTQVPFHIRRILAPVLGLPVKRIRVIKPRIGGGFGNKQELFIEDICAHLTIATGRPVRLEYTREEQFGAGTSRHAMRFKMRAGVTNDGRLIAHEMLCLSDTGAFGNHGFTVTGNTGHKSMGLYDAPNIRFHADIVYTNKPPSGAYRGYGAPQGFWAVEQHMEHIARSMGWDPIEFRLKNAVRAGSEHPISKVWSEGRDASPEIINTCALPECVAQGAAAIDWYNKFNNPAWHNVPGKPWLRRGIGLACVMQGTAIARLDMGAASIKMNDDGSFNLLIGATDLGTGSDTVITQMAAEIIGCSPQNFITYSSDTDFTPFDKGAYASSTTYISGAAAVKAARQVEQQIREVAARMFTSGSFINDFTPGTPVEADEVTLHDSVAYAPDGRTLSFQDIALNSLHHDHQTQIMGIGSYVSPESPPPFAAVFAEVLVDTETGQVTVERLVKALDCGVIVNPATASGQVEGGLTQALGYAVSEEMVFDEEGRLLNPRFGDYKIFAAHEMPQIDVIFVETQEPSHPFGVKAVAEIPLVGAHAAIANAVLDAAGVAIREAPLLPEKVWRALKEPESA